MWKLILLIFVIIFALKYAIALTKRAILIASVKKRCKEKNLQFKKCKSLFKSVLFCDGSADFEVGNAVVHILSPLFRLVRYSFTDDRRVETIIARAQSGVSNLKGSKKAGYVSNIFTFCNNKLKKLGNTNDGKNHILLVYPIPFEVTRVEDNKITQAYNGDEVWKNCIFSNKSYFIENIERFAD